jgi:hypothetical protein
MKTSLLKRLLVGAPMPLAQARHERLTKTIALAVFSSDALSSVAYSTEEILLILVLAGTAAAHLTNPIALPSPACLPWSRSRISRLSTPIRAAAARTSLRAPIWVPRRG